MTVLSKFSHSKLHLVWIRKASTLQRVLFIVALFSGVNFIWWIKGWRREKGPQRKDSIPDSYNIFQKKGYLDKQKSLFPTFPISEKIGVNALFFKQLKSLLKVLFPSKGCKETGLIILHTLFLILRTYLSVVVARLDGRLVKDMVAVNKRRFFEGLVLWFAVGIPATYTNSMIRYLQTKLSISFRTRLTHYAHELYLDEKRAFYKLLNLDNRIQGVDQYLTTDIAKFCDTLSGLYSNLAKPLLDMIIFNYQLIRSIGVWGTSGLFLNYLITAKILKLVQPGFGRMAAKEAELEGEYRNMHSRIITNAEEIAFYHGGPLEHTIVEKTYMTLVRHINKVFKIRIAYNMFEDFVVKYSWSSVGFIVCSLPVFWPDWAGIGHDENEEEDPNMDKRTSSNTKGFITNKRLMLSLADAGGRFMYSYKDLAELAGYTSRVYSLFSVLHALRNNEYSTDSSRDNNTTSPVYDPVGGLDVPVFTPYTLQSLEGTIHHSSSDIIFQNIPVVAPARTAFKSGDVLLPKLSFSLEQGHHLFITGPNGAGKTAIARILSEIWPVYEGKLTKPNIEDILIIPQRPYLSIGTLREQLIYPQSVEQMRKDGRTDDELVTILDNVHLHYILDREGGWDSIKEWKDVFSGGEKQRLSMARVLYHKPKFAILDECTSAVSSDVEGLMYNAAKESGITLITISHRPTLAKYHKVILSLAGGNEGKYEFEHLWDGKKNSSTSDLFNSELDKVENKLRQVEGYKKRLAEINQELQLSV